MEWTFVPSTRTSSPMKQCNIRFTSGDACGSVHDDPGSSLISQIANSDSVRDAHESGGGEGGRLSPIGPAMTSTNTPGAGVTVGIDSLHNMPKCAGTIFDSGGRFSQVWNSSSGLERSGSSRGNISECMIPLPVVSH